MFLSKFWDFSYKGGLVLFRTSSAKQSLAELPLDTASRLDILPTEGLKVAFVFNQTKCKGAGVDRGDRAQDWFIQSEGGTASSKEETISSKKEIGYFSGTATFVQSPDTSIRNASGLSRPDSFQLR